MFDINSWLDDEEKNKESGISGGINAILDTPIKKTPSQIAKQEQKVIVEEEKPSLVQRAKSFVKGIFKKKDTGEEKQDILGNDIIVRSADNTLLKALEDRYNRLEIENRSDKPRPKRLLKLQNEISEIEQAIDTKSFGEKWLTADKYYRERNVSGFKAGFVGVVGSILDSVIGLTEQNETTKNISEKIKLPFIEHTLDKYVSDISPTNPDFVDVLTQGVGSMATFYVAPTLVGGGAAIPNVLESLGEAGSVYDTNKKQGDSPTEAFKKSAKTFAANIVWNSLLNKYSGLFEGVGKPAVKELKKKVMSAFKASSFEGIQEIGQQVFSNIQTGRPVWEGVIESGGAGFIIGGGAKYIEISTGGEIPTVEVTKPTGEIEEKNKEYNLKQFEENPTVAHVPSLEGNPFVKLTPEQALKLKNEVENIKVKEGEEILHLTKESNFKGKKPITPEELAQKSEVARRAFEKVGIIPKSGIKLFNGFKGSVTEARKSYKKVLDVSGYQLQLLEKMARAGNVDAQAVLKNRIGQKIDFTSADKVIREFYRGKYDAIKYDNKVAGREEVGDVYHDLNENKFYAKKRETAQLYARMRGRKLKYKEETKLEKDMVGELRKNPEQIKEILDNPKAWSAQWEEVALKEGKRQLAELEKKADKAGGLDYLLDDDRGKFRLLNDSIARYEDIYIRGDAKERLELKRKLKKLGVEFDKDAPIKELQKLYDEAIKTTKTKKKAQKPTETKIPKELEQVVKEAKEKGLSAKEFVRLYNLKNLSRGDVIQYTDKYGKTTVGTVEHVGTKGLGSEQVVVKVKPATGKAIKLQDSQLDSIKLLRKTDKLSEYKAETFEKSLLETQGEFNELRENPNYQKYTYYLGLKRKLDGGNITQDEFTKLINAHKITPQVIKSGKGIAKRIQELRELPFKRAEQDAELLKRRGVGGRLSKQQLIDIYNQAVKEAKPIKAKTKGIPKELEPLAKEARKYKNAKEFSSAIYADINGKNIVIDDKIIKPTGKLKKHFDFFMDVKTDGVGGGVALRRFYRRVVEGKNPIVRGIIDKELYNQAVKEKKTKEAKRESGTAGFDEMISFKGDFERKLGLDRALSAYGGIVKPRDVYKASQDFTPRQLRGLSKWYGTRLEAHSNPAMATVKTLLDNDIIPKKVRGTKPEFDEVQKKAAKELAKRIKADERTEEIIKFVEVKTGKPITKASAKAVREAFIGDEVLPLNERSELILKRITSPARGAEVKFTLNIRPALFWGGVSRNVFTDGYLLITDKTAAKKFNQEVIEKEKKTLIKKFQKESPKLTYKQAEKFADDAVKGSIEGFKDQQYPDISKVIPKKYSKREVKILGFDGQGNVFISNGEHRAVVNTDKLAFMQKRLPNAQIRLAGNYKSPVVFERNGNVVGVLMPIRLMKAFPFKDGKAVKSVQKSKASADLYADLPNVTQKEVIKTRVPFPEMVRLAKDLMGKYPVIKKPRVRKAIGRPYGLFVPRGDGTIILNPDLFDIKKGGGVEQAAKTLAHEIGHLTDYLPDKVMARGNILGRIGTLRKFLRHTFTDVKTEKAINELIIKRSELQNKRRALERDEDGKVIKSLKPRDLELLRKIRPINKKIRVLQEKAIKKTELTEELKKLSVLWKPFQKKEMMINAETGKSELVVTEVSEAEVDEEYLSYRYSPEELYADAISVLINDPLLLQREAPIFHKSFFENLHRKPKVKEAYFELMDFLNQPDDVVQTKRLDTLYKGFKEAREKRLEIEARVKPKRSWQEKFMQQHVTRFDPIYRKLDEKFNDYGLFLSPKTKLRMQLEEMQMRQNDAYSYLNKINKDVVEPLEKIGLTEDDLGVILTLERNLADRKDIANPYGLQGKYSQETLDFFKNYLSKKKGITDEQFNILHQVARKFREYQFETVKAATEAQLYSKKFFEETALPNKDTYATYQVIEYIHDNYVSAGIKKATGTLKPIENPFVSSVLKTMAVMNQTEIQKGKLEVIKQLQEHFPEDLSKSKPVKVGRATVRWKPVQDRTALELFEDGKRVAYDVDPSIARMFEFYSPTEVHNLVRVSSKFNRVFKPLVTTWNLSWGFYSNISRDTRRTYKNLATILPRVEGGRSLSVFEFIRTWLSSIPTSVKFQKGNLTPLLEEMIDSKAYTTAFTSFDVQANEDRAIAPVMRKFRFLKKATDVKNTSIQKKMLDQTIGRVIRAIEFAGSVFETTTKVAGYQLTQKRIDNARLAGFITRNYVGTPNFIDGGTMKHIDNNIFVFSNVMAQGIRTDLELATDPTTRSGYWYQTFRMDILPKLMMLAAISGLLGDKLKEIYEKQTEYKKTNYIVVPVGVRPNGKPVFWNIPQDETGRLFSALTWKIGTAITGDLKKPEQIFALGAGYIPSVTPMWEVAGAWLNYAQDKNPYDNYRGRQVVDDLTWKAGGLPVFKKMIQYTTNNLGLSQFTTYSDETDTTFDVILKQTPIINRAFNSTDYGLKEKERAIKRAIDKKNARRILKERELLDKAIKEARKNPEKKNEIWKSLLNEAVGSKPYDDTQKRRATNLKKKFRIGLIRGSSREMDSLIDAYSNEYKLELFRMYKQSLNNNKYRQLVIDARRYGVISDKMLDMLRNDKLY